MKWVTGSLVILGILFYATSAYVHTQQAEYVAQMELLIAKQEATLISIAEVTDRDGADAIVSAIVKDCDLPEREKFDDLLSRLGSLNRTQLVEVGQLFNACGNFYAERKAVMVARFVREFDVYRDYINLLTIVDSRTDTVTYPVEKWSELVQYEIQRSELSDDLVRIQDEIIQSLLADVPVQSEEILEMTSEATNARETLGFIGVKIDTLRESLISL